MSENVGWQVLKRAKNQCVTTLVGKWLVERDDVWPPRDLVGEGEVQATLIIMIVIVITLIFMIIIVIFIITMIITVILIVTMIVIVFIITLIIMIIGSSLCIFCCLGFCFELCILFGNFNFRPTKMIFKYALKSGPKRTFPRK